MKQEGAICACAEAFSIRGYLCDGDKREASGENSYSMQGVRFDIQHFGHKCIMCESPVLMKAEKAMRRIFGLTIAVGGP